MTQSNEQQWYFSKGGQQQGPVAKSRMKRMVADGRVQAGDLVWTNGMAQWVAANTVAELAPQGGAGRVPSLPPPMAMPLPYATPQGASNPGQDPGMRWLLPVGRSGWAIAAGYLGLFSFLVLPAPLSLIISIVAIRDIKTHPDRHGMGRAIFGLVMGILGTLILTFGIVLPFIAPTPARHH